MAFKRRKLENYEYDIIEQHLKEGWSFWSVTNKVDIGVYALTRLNREDLKLKELRNKYDLSNKRLKFDKVRPNKKELVEFGIIESNNENY